MVEAVRLGCSVAVRAPLTPVGPFVDALDADLRAFTARAERGGEGVQAAQRLFAAVRDGIRYRAFIDYSLPESYHAGATVRAGHGFCVAKAAVLAAGARVLGIQSRVGFAVVRNHLASPKLRALIRGALVHWHGYALLFLGGRWVKLSPSFDRETCRALGVPVLEFDGTRDALLQANDCAGRAHMEYVLDRGVFDDVPFARISSDLRRLYPELWALGIARTRVATTVASPPPLER